MRILAVLLFIALAPPAGAEIYRWTDAQGNVVFGDQPPAGVNARPVEIRPNVVTAPKPMTEAVRPQPPAEEAGEAEAPAAAYQSLRILFPEHDSSVRENAGNLTVQLALEPPLRVKAGHRLELRLDGQVAASEAATQITLTNVDRGTHVLQADVVDAAGRPLISSEPVTFTLHRHSILPPAHLPGAGTPKP